MTAENTANLAAAQARLDAAFMLLRQAVVEKEQRLKSYQAKEADEYTQLLAQKDSDAKILAKKLAVTRQEIAALITHIDQELQA